VLLAKPESPQETANDLDGQIMTFWRVLRDRPEEFIRACALTPHSRAELQQAREDTDDELEMARRVWVQLAQGRAGRWNTTGWKYIIGSAGMPIPEILDGFVERMAGCAARLRHVSLECLPAVDLVKRYGTSPDVLIYADPPYLIGSHEGRMDASGYKVAMADELSHRELAMALNEAKASVVLSGYAHPLYDQELYAGWSRVELHTFTGNGLLRDGNGTAEQGRRVEVLWSNRPLLGAPRKQMVRQADT
jgi:DNA adenine methylase